MHKVISLDELISTIAKQMKEIDELQGIQHVSISRGYIIWKSCFSQMKMNESYIKRLKELQ